MPRFVLVLLLSLLSGPALAERITVFAAASLGDVLGAAAAAWEEESGHEVTLVLAGSSTLARQLAAGAEGDLVVLANAEWMAWLEAKGALAPPPPVTLAGNALVLVAPGAGGAAPMKLTSETDLMVRLGPQGRLATALTAAVPSGIYSAQALKALSLWEALQPRLAETDNVRAALALVALGEAPLGAVYATDARAEPRVHVVYTVPPETHDPILYPAALTAAGPAPDAARAFLDWLSGATGQAVFAEHGFVPPPR
ncbi:molybdate ABC transporter substrate-binding protein [Litorisediminicola beolgyonensis]|uniref:Molybdate ABC transporter substrate-binding protein n=1 Tax=Litorisediminicola beolgyonensis TaxID=1173614 RepID=A0ABW3ZNQ6_9RHOB